LLMLQCCCPISEYVSGLDLGKPTAAEGFWFFWDT
jgi:hypothetical protein